MLADFCGKPLIGQLLQRFSDEGEGWRCIVLTSSEASDDPLEDYVRSRAGIAVFRGSLDDVFERFKSCLRLHPCEYVVRISGDSPLLDPKLPAAMMKYASPGVDLVTNVARRTFPPGQSVECIRSSCFEAVDGGALSTSQREHVTGPFYESARGFRLCRIVSSIEGAPPMVVDQPEDLLRVSALAQSHWGEIGRFAASVCVESQ